MTLMVHGRAQVDSDCLIGAGTKVWQFASVIRGSVVGMDCTIASCALVDAARIGDRCSVGHGAAVEPGTVLRDDVFVGPGVVFCNDRWPRTSKHGFSMEALLSGEVWSIVVSTGASIGARCVIMPGVVVGPCAMVAAGAIVRVTVPPYHLLKVDGSIEPIDSARVPDRMRLAYHPGSPKEVDLGDSVCKIPI